jgi:hypothetical protein
MLESRLCGRTYESQQLKPMFAQRTFNAPLSDATDCSNIVL